MISKETKRDIFLAGLLWGIFIGAMVVIIVSDLSFIWRF